MNVNKKMGELDFPGKTFPRVRRCRHISGQAFRFSANVGMKPDDHKHNNYIDLLKQYQQNGLAISGPILMADFSGISALSKERQF
jgi:hypothetical protein